jgi:hypothetical protein
MIGKQTLEQKWREQSEAAKREAKNFLTASNASIF